MKNGSLIISIDFELFWGLRDLKYAEKYRKNVIGAKQVIPKMVKLFNEYNVQTTFAVVGLLLCDSKVDIYKYSPLKKPSYNDKTLSPYQYIDKLTIEEYDFYFAGNIIKYLKNQSNIEIATHTFSHYYCTAEGQMIDEFEDDLNAAIVISKDNNIELSSIIFPRNEVNDEYLRVCESRAIYNYRGNPNKYFNKNSFRNKIMRFLDTYINLDKHTAYNYNEIQNGRLYNIRASRFLRPYSQSFFIFENLKMKRIKNEMKKAAINNLVYHLWWHPHNFGINIDKNLKMLEEILKYYSYLKSTYGMNSFNMSELAKKLNNGNKH